MGTLYRHIRDFLEKTPKNSLQKTNSPNIVCTRLPSHWRSNKSLQNQFNVLILTPVPDNTIVSISAGNDETPCGEMRNESSKVHRQVAKFQDLRFIGKSGRGKQFNLTIVVHSTPMMVAIAPAVIKVTVDGPRDARLPKAGTMKRLEAPFPYPEYPIIPSYPPIMWPTILSPELWLTSPQLNASPLLDASIHDSPSETRPTIATMSTPSRKRDISDIPSLDAETPSGSTKRRRNDSIMTSSSTNSSPGIWRPYI